jgi:Transposase
VAGVDDFAIRRGQHYGTLIIDIETGAPLDLLEGRDARPLADWLAAHPGVEVICRDRAGSYADGARTGAPDAVQVADRFHLRQNLAKAVEKRVAAHRACLAAPAPPTAAPDDAPDPREPEEAGQPDPTGKYAERARRNHELVHHLRAEGRGLREIARHLGWGLHTVQRLDRAATWQELAGKDRAPASSTRSSPTSTSTPTAHMAASSACSARSKPSATTAATPSSATTSAGTARPGSRCRQPRPPSATSRTGSPAARTP